MWELLHILDSCCRYISLWKGEEVPRIACDVRDVAQGSHKAQQKFLYILLNDWMPLILDSCPLFEFFMVLRIYVQYQFTLHRNLKASREQACGSDLTYRIHSPVSVYWVLFI